MDEIWAVKSEEISSVFRVQIEDAAVVVSKNSNKNNFKPTRYLHEP
jgi:hypothetical protein